MSTTNSERLVHAERLMREFASSTGLLGSSPPRRYLWTDAYAVCNFLELHKRTEKNEFLNLAISLVDQVHEILGKHRPDDQRRGWISGLSESEAERHPTIAGLRIGKPKPERKVNEAHNERDEWNQDGQYYHYLTRWILALYCMAISTGQEKYWQWSVELAVAANHGFRADAHFSRLYWKMSIDLSYPLVTSSGQHDSLDGLVSCTVLKAMPSGGSSVGGGYHQKQLMQELEEVIDGLVRQCARRSWVTHDCLGIGGLLIDAGHIAQLPSELLKPDADFLFDSILQAAEVGLAGFAQSNIIRHPAKYRMAFREFGLAIGLQSIDLMYENGHRHAMLLQLDRLRRYVPLHKEIENFWVDPIHRVESAWFEHKDINEVMLATSFIPDTLLSL